MTAVLYDLGSAIRALSGLLLLALGLAVLFVRPHRRANTAFAVFSGALGLFFLLRNLSNGTAIQEEVYTATSPLSNVIGIAVFLVALWYPRPLGRRDRRLVVLPVLLVVVFSAISVTQQGVFGSRGLGPELLTPPWIGALLLLALRYARASEPAASGERAQIVLASGVLALYPAYVAAEGGLYPLVVLADPLASLDISLAGSLTLSAVWFAIFLRAPPEGRRGARNVALLIPGVIVATALLRLLAGPEWVQEGTGIGRGIVRTVTVFVFGYAIVRHQLLGIDLKVKWTLKQSTVAAIFIGLFFIVSESAAAFFSDRVGTYMGIVAAGTLVFAIAPLQHFAQRVADRAMPGVKAFGEMTEDERLLLYRRQLAAAWADGAMSSDERRLLEIAREQLGIGAEEALRMEREVVP